MDELLVPRESSKWFYDASLKEAQLINNGKWHCARSSWNKKGIIDPRFHNGIVSLLKTTKLLMAPSLLNLAWAVPTPEYIPVSSCLYGETKKRSRAQQNNLTLIGWRLETPELLVSAENQRIWIFSGVDGFRSKSWHFSEKFFLFLHIVYPVYLMDPIHSLCR